jgi:hypothetical protein
MFRYGIFIVCRTLSAGLGYVLSVIGIATGSDFGRLVALLDAVKPVSGLFDSLATRAAGRVFASEMLLCTAAALLIALVTISLLADNLLTVAVLATYIVLWWLLTSFSTVFMRRETPFEYGRLAHHSGLLMCVGIRRVLANRSTLALMATSTIAAAAYVSLYLFDWTKQELLALRLNDAALLVVSFTAQLMLRGETLSRMIVVGTLLATILAAAGVQYIAGGWMGLFVLFRVGSLFACARAMHNRCDRLISVNQVVLAVSYLAFGTWAADSSDLPALLAVEFISLVSLLWLGSSSLPPTAPGGNSHL